MKIFYSPAFKKAVTIFVNIIQTPLPPEVLLEDLKMLKIVSISLTPPSLYGMVLSHGIAINLTNIRELVKPEEENPEEKIVKIGLWTALQEIGHHLIQSEDFAKMTQSFEYSCSDYQNLEVEFLFSKIFLGSFDKKIWENPNLILKLMNI